MVVTFQGQPTWLALECDTNTPHPSLFVADTDSAEHDLLPKMRVTRVAWNVDLFERELS